MPHTPARRRAGRPPKIANALRWQLYIDPAVRELAETRARGEGRDLPDVMRDLMADYAAERVTPSTVTA